VAGGVQQLARAVAVSDGDVIGRCHGVLLLLVAGVQEAVDDGV
jgi:hypothetical protein